MKNLSSILFLAFPTFVSSYSSSFLDYYAYSYIRCISESLYTKLAMWSFPIAISTVPTILCFRYIAFIVNTRVGAELVKHVSTRKETCAIARRRLKFSHRFIGSGTMEIRSKLAGIQSGNSICCRLCAPRSQSDRRVRVYGRRFRDLICVYYA